MADRTITRRTALGVAGAAAATGVFADSGSRPKAGRTREMAARLERALADPRERARIKAKIQGSCGEETVYTFCRLHLYLWLGDGNLKPMFTLQNLSANTWKPLPNGNYAGVMHEVGVYTKFDTDELIDYWDNPVTGERREVWQFIGGPLQMEIGPDGLVTGEGATLKPLSMRMDILGDTVILPTSSAFSFPNPMDPKIWTKEVGGPMMFWDSHYYYAARIAEVLDPRVTNARAAVQFQNLVSFHPWLGMGRTPGRTWGKGLGAKLGSLDELPTPVRAALEKRAPEIFDISSWTKPRLDFVEYMQKRKPG